MRGFSFVVVVGCLMLAAAACRESAPQPVCPDCNIVLISMDTLRASHVGAYGYSRPTTPNVDVLAQRGVVFENAIAQSSWTRPAHMSMLTGMYPAEHGYVGLADRKRLAADVPTLAAVLARHGWRTAAFTGGLNVDPSFGFDIGFETYRVAGRSFRDTLGEAKRWLAANGDRRFFAFLHGYDPHTPYRSDASDRAALGLGELARPNGFRRACKRQNAVRVQRYVDAYDGAIHHGDRHLGELFGYLEELGLMAKTIVVFTSDHGEEFLEHGRCFHLTTLYREVLHVPLIVAGPGIASRRVSELVPASIGIASTILDLVGIEDHPLPGPSLASALMGEHPRFDAVVSETYRSQRAGRGRGHVLAVTRAHDKLIHWATEGVYEYYDLVADPREQAARADGPGFKRLQELLAVWVAAHSVRATHEARPEAEGHDLREELRALGYIE